jgi:hypothetical protein
MVGREVGVLFEKPGRMPGQMTGKSDHLHAVHVMGDVAPGDLRRVQDHRRGQPVPGSCLSLTLGLRQATASCTVTISRRMPCLCHNGAVS